MVKDGAQLYTMEGIAAGLIMLLTTYLVLGSTSVYTPGDTHITDMQLEQVGSDILRVMDTPVRLNNTLIDNSLNRSDLEQMVNTTNGGRFFSTFTNTYLCNPEVVANAVLSGCGDIQVNASVWYLTNSGSLGTYMVPNPNPGLSSVPGPGVRVTHWIHTNYKPGPAASVPGDMKNEPQELLLEVVMWKA
ncbi:MAG TPA: hypothetical protein VEI51_07240 [Methanomicrobiales archaeon]|nr:hypothetical protein [Methanomicrobiales archaeon]